MDFLNKALFGQKLRLAIDKWDLIKLTNFYTTEEINWVNEPKEGERISISYTSSRRLISRIFKEINKQNQEKNIIKKWAMNVNTEFSKAERKIAEEYLKTCSRP